MTTDSPHAAAWAAEYAEWAESAARAEYSRCVNDLIAELAAAPVPLEKGE